MESSNSGSLFLITFQMITSFWDRALVLAILFVTYRVESIFQCGRGSPPRPIPPAGRASSLGATAGRASPVWAGGW